MITGLDDLLSNLEGGLKAGEICLIMGQPNQHKTMIVRKPTQIDRITRLDGSIILAGEYTNGIIPMSTNLYQRKIKNKIMTTAQVVLINKDGLVLGVSRKTDHNDFGLPGGRMEPQDYADPTNTAIRECKEETGLDISNLRLVFAIHKGGNMGYTYLANYDGEINHNEPHVVAWCKSDILTKGSFGRYNELVFESLYDMGIKLVLWK